MLKVCLICFCIIIFKIDIIFYRNEVKLTSILTLRADVEKKCHTGLKETLKNHTFVGCVNPQYGLIQHSTKLYLTNTVKLW